MSLMTNKIFLFASLACLFSYSQSYAQKDTNTSKNSPFIFITGKIYKVIVKGGIEVEGVILSQDSNSISIKTKSKTYDIDRSDLAEVESFESTSNARVHSVSDTTLELDVYMTDRKLYKDVRIKRPKDSIVVILKENARKTINLYNINKIIYHENSFLKGIGIGALVGFGTGFITGFIVRGAFRHG